MTTGVSTIEAAQECLRAGACTHIVKPIDFDHLSAIITQALQLETEGAGFVHEPEEKKPEPKVDTNHMESSIDAETKHKVDAVIKILMKMGMITYQDLLEEIEKLKEGSD